MVNMGTKKSSIYEILSFAEQINVIPNNVIAIK